MLKFDKKQKEGVAYKVRKPEMSYVYKSPEMYNSYMQYVKYGIRKDIEDYLIPKLEEVLVDDFWLERLDIHDSDRELNPTKAPTTSVLVKYDKTSSFRDYEYYSVLIKFGGVQLLGISQPFCIFKIPFMDEFGVLTRNGSKYAIISELVQDNAITYNGPNSDLKIITRDGNYINLEGKANKISMRYNRKKVAAVEVLFALANIEGVDKDQLIDRLVSKDLWAIKDSKNYTFMKEYGSEEGSATNSFKFATDLKSDKYNIGVVREMLNEALKLDRVLGRRLAENIKLNGNEILKKDTIINEFVLQKIKDVHIDTVKVIEIPNMVGYYTSEVIILRSIRKGTFMFSEIKEAFPDKRGMYMDEDVVLPDDDPILILNGRQVDCGFLEALQRNGIEYVKLKEDMTSSVDIKVPFSISVVSNRCFFENDEWVFYDEEGNKSECSEYLTTYDLVALISLYERLSNGKCYDIVANRDLGLRKKVNQANELFHKAFKLSVDIFVNKVKSKLKNMYTNDISDFGKPDVMESIFYTLETTWWRNLYKKMKVIQRVELDNPLAFYSSLNKINTIVKSKHAVTKAQRAMSMHHYGRLCPYETPSGKNMGIVSNKASGCVIEDSLMKTSYFRVIHTEDGKHYINFGPVLLSVYEEEKYCIADIASLTFDEKSGLITSTDRVIARVPERYGLEKMTLGNIEVKDIDLVNTDCNQGNGIPALTIPFQGANDAARVILGLSMGKQAKGLLWGDIPAVSTSGFKTIPRISTYYMIQAEHDGLVVEINPGMIAMYYTDINETKVYEFDQSEFTSQTVITRTPVVEEGQEVKAGDILVKSNFTKDGYLTIGVPCLCAYIPVGYNYEDGVYCSQRLSEISVSYGSHSCKTPIPKAAKHSLVKKVDKFRYINPGERACIVQEHIAGVSSDIAVKSDDLYGFVVDAKKVQDVNDNSNYVLTTTVSFDPLKEGDKLANRHGNKGVAPAIRKNTDMPLLPNGEIIDKVYNPMGVGSRMNIGQILEIHLGLAVYILQIRNFESDSFNGASEEEVKMLLSYAWDLAHTDDCESVFNDPAYKEIPRDLHDHCRENIEAIRDWRGCFNKDGTAKLLNPRTGKYYETPIPIGVTYVYKLIHEAQKKEHARGGFCTSRYVEKLSCPTKGAGAEGGQRFGYMELDALAAYGANAVIRDALNACGDNPVARNNLTARALLGSDIYDLDEETSMRRSTEIFVNMLEGLNVHQDFDGILPGNDRASCSKRKVYKQHALWTAAKEYGYHTNKVEEDEPKAKKYKKLSDYRNAIGDIG